MRISIELAIGALDEMIKQECDRLSCAFVATPDDPDPSDPASPCNICHQSRQSHRIIAN